MTKSEIDKYVLPELKDINKKLDTFIESHITLKTTVKLWNRVHVVFYTGIFGILSSVIFVVIKGALSG